MKLINADELIEKCGEWYTEEGSEEGFIGTLKQLLNEQPTVDAQPVRHGHWIGIDDEPCEVFECDVCGYIYETDSKLHRYCPNCGAKMGDEHEII